MELNDATNIEVGSCIRDTTLYRIMEKKKLECFNDLADVNLIIDDYEARPGNQIRIQKSQKDTFRLYRCCEQVKCTFQVRFSRRQSDGLCFLSKLSTQHSGVRRSSRCADGRRQKQCQKKLPLLSKETPPQKRWKSSLQPLQPLLENVAPKPSAECANPPDGAQVSHVLLSRDCLNVIAPMFVQVYRNLKSMIEKEDMQWTMLRIAHEQSPIPLIGEAMHMMVKMLQQEEATDSVVEVGERDVCSAQCPKPYVQRNASFVKEFLEVVNRDSKTNVLKSILVTLKAEGFRFLEKQEMHGNWQPMSMALAINLFEDE
jgi:hypothetical protein